MSMRRNPRDPTVRVNEFDPLHVAQHEAAHVVVGVALDLRLYEAVTAVKDEPRGYVRLGYTWFYMRKHEREAFALMLAAGIAWDVQCGLLPTRNGGSDWHMLRRMGYGIHAIRAFVRSAGAILAGRAGAHEKVTRALLAGRITSREILRIARGQRVRSV